MCLPIERRRLKEGSGSDEQCRGWVQIGDKGCLRESYSERREMGLFEKEE